MGLLQNAIRKWKDQKESQKDYERDVLMRQKFAARQLSSNERELMRFQKEDRAKEVKKALEKRRNVMQNNIWSGREGNPLFAPNIIAGQKELFKGENNIFKHSQNILNQRNIFTK